ncbi:MAG: ribonuclease PH, partial [Actinomycetota bacterium]|nr:ribonuclease PH [Actinomycetota bacterium]
VVALADACRALSRPDALRGLLAAVSVGIVAGQPLLDLCYVEDNGADVDMNVVLAGDGRFVELQGTAEHAPFSRAQADALLDLAAAGCRELFAVQRAAVAP